MLESMRAAIGDENMVRAFWLAIGTLLFSNAGMAITAVVSFFRKQRKMRTDLNEAFKRIRILEKQTNQENKDESTSSTLQK